MAESLQRLPGGPHHHNSLSVCLIVLTILLMLGPYVYYCVVLPRYGVDFTNSAW